MKAHLRLALLLASLPGSAAAQSVFPRVQQLVNAGNRQQAQIIADSALTAAPAGSDEFADALFARAYATTDAGAAERDYVRLSVEFPRSPRLEEALFLSGQFRMARNDRAGARRQFDRLVLEFPNGPNAARAALWAGRMALADGDLAHGCATLALASGRESADVELQNEIEYVRARCRTQGAVPADSLPADTTGSGVSTPPDASLPGFSVQVAAYATRAQAVRLNDQLHGRGFQVRVVGTRAPFRVRVGRYATRELAAAALGRMKAAGVSGIVVEAEPR
jgi:hypothetical protein